MDGWIGSNLTLLEALLSDTALDFLDLGSEDSRKLMITFDLASIEIVCLGS